MSSVPSNPYDTRTTYARHRRPDPRIARAIIAALGDADSVVNVGAGPGSYEPADRWVVAVEPSRTMLRQRPPVSAPVVRAVAETLPFPAAAFDAALAEGRPALIELRVDPEAITPRATLSQIRGS